MFTVLSNTRNFNLYIIAALAIMMVVLLTFAVAPAISAPSPVLAPITGISESTSDYFQRHSELSAASKSADLSWPPRPVIIPVTGANAFSDYFQRHSDLNALTGAEIAVDMTGDFSLRHPEWASSAQNAVVPGIGNSEAPDYYQRHPDLNAPVGIVVDMTDYFIRHSELRQPMNSIDLSDYFLRH